MNVKSQISKTITIELTSREACELLSTLQLASNVEPDGLPPTVETLYKLLQAEGVTTVPTGDLHVQ